MKIQTLLLTLTILGVTTLSAIAEPLTLKCSKGNYTIDEKAGTYKGCLYKGGCLSLGPNQRIANTTWQKGDYKYDYTDGAILVYKNGKLILRDCFHDDP